jgi:hypothetical protein
LRSRKNAKNAHLQPSQIFLISWSTGLKMPAIRRKDQGKKKATKASDDVVSVARRLQCDEDKGRFEKLLGKIAKTKPTIAKTK